MIAESLLGGKSAKIAMMQRRNPIVSMTLPKFNGICEDFKRSITESDGIIQLSQELFNNDIPGMIAKIHVLREIHFYSFLRLDQFGFYSEVSKKKFFC